MTIKNKEQIAFMFPVNGTWEKPWNLTPQFHWNGITKEMPQQTIAVNVGRLKILTKTCSWSWWHTPIIPESQQAEAEGSQVRGQTQ